MTLEDFHKSITATEPPAGLTPALAGRREIMLTRLMLVAIDIVLAGERLGLEMTRDLFREVRHCYPELVDEFV
jgi:hypothetical protein